MHAHPVSTWVRSCCCRFAPQVWLWVGMVVGLYSTWIPAAMRQRNCNFLYNCGDQKPDRWKPVQYWQHQWRMVAINPAHGFYLWEGKTRWFLASSSFRLSSFRGKLQVFHKHRVARDVQWRPLCLDPPSPDSLLTLDSFDLFIISVCAQMLWCRFRPWSSKLSLNNSRLSPHSLHLRHRIHVKFHLNSKSVKVQWSSGSETQPQVS